MIREQIANTLIQLVEDTGLFHEIRRTLPTFKEFSKISPSKMPIACVSLEMPKPVYDRENQSISFKMNIDAQIVCYGLIERGQEPDYYNSFFLEKIWQQLTALSMAKPVINIRYTGAETGYISPYNITSLQFSSLYAANKDDI
jgi:hypothetical protein